uniref:B30.2/SPRY domain-containing protein n=1 Tax=Neogobius melanostomus TaxID=47308 RepID=A0A8C6TY18_9GOBI
MVDHRWRRCVQSRQRFCQSPPGETEATKVVYHHQVWSECKMLSWKALCDHVCERRYINKDLLLLLLVLKSTAGCKLTEETLHLKTSLLQGKNHLYYFTPLALNSNTAYRFLHVSESSRRASHVKEDQAYPAHPDRFDSCPQLLCSPGLSGRAYWEVDWSGAVQVAVSYRSVTRKGNSAVCGFGLGPESWSLSCSRGRYSVTHNGKRTMLPYSSTIRGRAAVYVDFLAGRLSFYALSSEEPVHLHSFSGTFTQPLFPGFQLLLGSSVELCGLLEEEPPYSV